MKGMVFAGCSFTWGEGLHLYSDVCDVVYTKNQNFDTNNIKESHKKSIETNRFARKIANHFDSWEICKEYNGGSNLSSLEFIKKNFGIDDNYKLKVYPKPKFNIKDISCLVFQVTHPERGPFLLYSNKNNIMYKMNIVSLDNESLNELPEEKDRLFKLYEEYGDLFEYQISKTLFDELEKLFIFLEKNKIVCKILFWQERVAELIENNNFFKDRLITLSYKNRVYNSIEELTNRYSKFKISGHFKKFDLQMNDDHPSKLCHQLISENIINNLENDINFIKYHFNITNNILPNKII
jgi:hypothetical protein